MRAPARTRRKELFMLRVLLYENTGGVTAYGSLLRSRLVLRVLLYENTGCVTACNLHLESATYEAPRGLSSNGHAGRLVTTEQPWAESMMFMPEALFMLFHPFCAVYAVYAVYAISSTLDVEVSPVYSKYSCKYACVQHGAPPKGFRPASACLGVLVAACPSWRARLGVPC